jgi:hypothetical protein
MLISYNKICIKIIYDLYFNINAIKIMINNYPLIIKNNIYIFLFLISIKEI